MELKKQKPTIFYLYYFVIFFGQSIHGSFLTLYLSNAGMDSATVGLLNGIVYIINLFVFPIWGMAADRASSKNRVLICGLVGCICSLIAFYNSKTILMLSIVMIIYSMFYNPMIGIYETITMEHVTRNGWNYSPIRMSGTIGYAIMAVIAGFWLSKREDLLFPIFILVMVIATILAIRLPKTQGRFIEKNKTEKKKKNKGVNNVYLMLKNKKVRNVLILFMMYNMCNAFNVTYYGIYMSDLGGSYTYVGIGNMIMALAEIPFHIGPGRRWMKRIGVEKSLLIVMAVGCVRWTVAALCQNAWMLVFTMAFNGIMLVPTIVGVVEFLYENAPDNLKASAQTALKAPFQVFGQLVANLVFGRFVGIFDAAGLPGIRIIYMFMAPLCLIVGALVGISIFRDEKKEKLAAEEEIKEIK